MIKKLLCLSRKSIVSESANKSSQYSHRLSDESFAQQVPEGRKDLISLERKRTKQRLQKQNLDLELKLISDIKENTKTKKKLDKEKATIAEWAFDDIDKPLVKKKNKNEVDEAVSEEISEKPEESGEESESDDLDSLLSTEESSEEKSDSTEFEDV
jgi:hypothetical protein